MTREEYTNRLQAILIDHSRNQAIKAIQALNDEAIGESRDDNNGWNTTNREQNELRQQLRAVIGKEK